MELTFESVEKLLKDSLRPIVARIDSLAEELREVKLDVKDLKVQIADVKESLSDLVNAEEKDAQATINHELRIQNLEQHANIESVPLAHLAEIE